MYYENKRMLCFGLTILLNHYKQKRKRKEKKQAFFSCFTGIKQKGYVSFPKPLQVRYTNQPFHNLDASRFKLLFLKTASTNFMQTE